jgi:SRSO17 transposase
MRSELEEIKGWAEGLENMAVVIRKHFARSSPFHRAVDYLKGLLSNIERKNGWQMAEALGEEAPENIQYLLNRSEWDADGVRDDLQAYVQEHLGEPDGVFVVDETGFLKKGNKSVGVQRQYSGTAGRIENCQIGVFLAYCSTQGYTLIDRELYLPESWLAEPERCKEAGVPEGIEFRTKGEIAQDMVETALSNGLSAQWVTGDEVYGNTGEFRRYLENEGLSYVLAVAAKEYCWVEFKQLKISKLIESVDSWQTLSAGEGSKGLREYDWARLKINGGEDGFERWALFRRSLKDPADIAYYKVHCPLGTSLKALVKIVGKRWCIETCFELAKQEVGLDEYEVRKWQGWYRHITLSMMALAYLTVIRLHAVKKGELFQAASTGSLATFKRKRGL